MDYGLKNQTAIVTGVRADSLGLKVTEMLLLEGCNVMAVYHGTPGDNKNTAYFDVLDHSSAKLKTIGADVSNEKDIDSLFEEALKQFGKVDIIVNNAGIWPQAFVKDMEVEEFRKTLDVNLIGPFLLSKKFVNYCIETNRKGKIVNLSSQAAFNGSTSGHAHYAASKAGLIAFSKSLAREVAPMGIHVNCVAPGIMESKMVSYHLDKPGEREKYLKRVPLGKIADHEDVAKTILFLCSNQSDYMTGATLDVNGGMVMR